MTDELSLLDHERAVERSRARLTEDLAVLCSPDTFATFTDDLKQEALDTRDAFWADLKSRATANPAAVAAIGAGLAWRIVQRPPIAAGLIGLGLYSLWKTDPKDPGTSDTYRAKKFVKDQTNELVATASDMAETVKTKAADAYDAAKEKAASLSDSFGQTVGEARATMKSGSETVAGVLDRAQENVRHRLHDAADAAAETIRDDDTRNNILLGVAGVAIAAALGIACQKRLSDTSDSV
jgi:hypothetical protein